VGIGADRIDVIGHGVPDTKFCYPDESNLRRSLNARTVFVSAGHARPAKGYHVALAALAILKRSYGDFKYLILGRAQPQYIYGDYPGEIEELIDRLGLKDNVIWVQEYLRLSELIDHISAADVGLVTYTKGGHASSGILPLMLASGRPVVATAFAYAVHMARHIPSIHMAPMNDPEHLCSVIYDSICDPESLRADMMSAYLSTRPFVWSRIGEEYDRVLRAAVS
jgi:glycosyltransferase involved in cell wall biosynthesis